MKNHFIYILFFLIGCTVLAQKKNSHQQKVTDVRAKFIINQLQLDSIQARKFISVHDEFRTEMFKIAKAKNRAQKRILKEKFTEAQAKDLNEEIEEKEKLLYENRVLFYKRTKKFLSNNQNLNLRLAEIKFKKKLLEKLK